MNALQLDGSFVGYTISSATLRLQDLIPAGLDFMAEYDKEGLAALNKEYLNDLSEGLAECYINEVANNGHFELRFYIDHISDLVDLGDDHPIWDYDWEGDILAWLWCESIFDRLNEIAPAGCYFGSHIGDGALIGFWVADND